MISHEGKKVHWPIQLNVTFSMETNLLISSVSQMTGFYIKCNSRENELKAVRLKLFPCNICCILSLHSFRKEQSVTGVPTSIKIFSSFHGTLLCSHFLGLLKKAATAKASKSMNSNQLNYPLNILRSHFAYSPHCFT